MLHKDIDIRRRRRYRCRN